MSNAKTTPDTEAHTHHSVVPLSFREVRFVNAYLEHGNATQAARDAGYKSSSEAGLRFLAHKLLTKPNVGEKIRNALGHYLDAELITAPRIAQTLGHQAFGDRTAIFDKDGAILMPSEWPKELHAIVVGIDVTETVNPRTGQVITRRVKVKFAEATKALKVLATWRGMIGSRAVVNQDATAPGYGVTVILESPDGEPQTDCEESLRPPAGMKSERETIRADYEV